MSEKKFSSIKHHVRVNISSLINLRWQFYFFLEPFENTSVLCTIQSLGITSAQNSLNITFSDRDKVLLCGLSDSLFNEQQALAW